MNNLYSYSGCTAIERTTSKTRMGGVKIHDNSYCRNVSSDHLGGNIANCTLPHTNKQQYTTQSEAKGSATSSCPHANSRHDRQLMHEIYSITNNLINMKRNLLKTLLVAVGLVMGVNVWAADITATLVHTAGSGWGSAAGRGHTVDSEKEYFNTDAATGWAGAAFAEFSFSIPEGQTITSATLTWSYYQYNSKTYTSGIYYLNKDVQIDYTNFANSTDAVQYTGQKTFITTTSAYQGAKNTGKLHTGITTDVTDAVKNIANNNQNFIIFQWTANSGSGDLVGKGASSNTPVLLITTTDASQQTSYTVKFTDGAGNELKEAVTYDILKGEQATASAADMASFFNTDYTKKYIYASGNETITATENAESNVITLVFREADKFNYTVKSSLGTTLVTGSDWEGQTMYVNYPRYLAQDGTLYYINKNSSGGWFQKTFTLTQDNQEETINYTAGSKGVVYLAEAENIETLTVSTAANSAIRCSNGSCAYNAGENDVVITNLPAGKYKLYTSAWGAAGTEFVFKAGENKIASTYKWTDENKTDPVPNSDGLFTSKGYIIDYESEEITLLSETDITLGATTDGSRGIDFIYIIKTGDATETVSVTDAGLATYCPSYGLDFTNAEKIAAYKASVSGNEVTLTKVTTVAKGEGVLLRSINGGAAEENIDMTVNETKDESNAFVGTLEDITVNETDGDNTNYVLSKENDAMGFYKAAVTGTNVAAGKAYLPVLTSDAAKGIKVVFDGETTGISTVKDNTVKDNTIYNLNGQRVAAPAKGLYIMNGKKVVIK